MKNIENIVLGCIRNDRASQLEFYNLYSKDIYYTIYRIIQNSVEAEDIMQNSFLKIFKKIDTYKEKPQIIIYSLKRIAINASIDNLRRRKLSFIEDIEAIPEVIEDEIDYENTEIRANQIKEAMNSLPNGARMILTLRIIEELSFDQIAKQLELKPSTVRTQYVRAKSKILKIIRDEKK